MAGAELNRPTHKSTSVYKYYYITYLGFCKFLLLLMTSPCGETIKKKGPTIGRT
jgi:hypothetical protein